MSMLRQKDGGTCKAHSRLNRLAHCGDYCAFVGYVGMEEPEKMGLADEPEDIYRKDSAFFDLDTIREGLYNGGSLQGYLFRCLVCGKYQLYADCDRMPLSEVTKDEQ